MDYKEFLKTKSIEFHADGVDVSPDNINSMLFPFQRDIVLWALKKGRAAIFADCGLGKTPMQLEWAYHIHQQTGKPTLIVAPLAVSGQTINEAKKFNREIEYCRLQVDADGVIDNITNYEMLAKFNMNYYGGIVLDESSILKNYTGKTKQLLVEKANQVQYRLACTATPAPNDALELGNHSEFLGIMPSNEMIQRYFTNDSMSAGGYRLREHGESHFWQWVASWAVALRWPSDVGNYDDDGYILPELVFESHIIPVDHSRAWDEVNKDGQRSLIITGQTSATNMHKEKRATLKRRMAKAAEIAKEAAKNDFVIVWIETHAEADELKKLIPEAVEVRGNEPLDIKRQKLEDFGNLKYRIIITKPKIAAHGLNWQHAGTQIWASITHKFEQFYQGYKRSHRFGRTEPVTCHLIYAESEGSILENVQRKHEAHEYMQTKMVETMQENGMSLHNGQMKRMFSDNADIERGYNWTLYHGDSAIAMKGEPDNSVDIIIQSPPFESLYIYSSHVEDLGNSVDNTQFYTQYGFILRDELRRMKPGAYKAEHCKDLPLYASRDGAMGLDDFPGRLIKAHLDNGFWFAGWKTIWKDPVIEMQRTKNAGLLWSEAFCKRAERARQGMADYVLIFQKPITGQSPPNLTVDCDPLPQSVIARCRDLWMNESEVMGRDLAIEDLLTYQFDMPTLAKMAKRHLKDGRNIVVRVSNPADMHVLIAEMKLHDMVFHSRIALTDGTWLIVFRKWVPKMPSESHVTHDLKADTHKFIGNQPPEFWKSDRHYSIQVWQRYASPVWFDLDGLPESHPDIWFDIDQTNVLNHRIAREDKDEKHICPLQLDLIDKCLALYAKPGDHMSTSFAGVGSEMVQGLEYGCIVTGSELKGSYFDLAVKHLRIAEQKVAMPTLFQFAGIS